MSALLNGLIAQRKKKALEYEEYLQKLAEEIVAPLDKQSDNWPKSCDSPAKCALYDNLAYNEALALAISDDLMKGRPAEWRHNKVKQNMEKEFCSSIFTPRKRGNGFSLSLLAWKNLDVLAA